MLQVNFIRQNKETLIQRMKVRGLDVADKVEKILELDDLRKHLQYDSDNRKAENKKASGSFRSLSQQGKKNELEELRNQIASNKNTIKENESKLDKTKEELYDILVALPNMPHESVPAGHTDEDNEVFKAWESDLPSLHEGAVPHWELAKKYDIIDMETGAKIAGAGFPLFKGKGAQLKRALVNFFLAEASDAGFLEVLPPHLVNKDTAFCTGQLPDKEGQMYYVTEDDLYLIPTAEVPVTNMYRDTIVSESDFPIKLTAYTPCFRREAGSYGSHVRGLNRVHQFEKVEIVMIEHPDRSYDTLQYMLRHVEGLLKKLELPYRILRLCGGDLGFTSALTFDFEVYSAAQNRWLEVSSVSNFETFQTNRLKCRFKDENKKSHLAHSLNGSALALARIVAALLENNQTADGIIIPEALRPYTRFDKID